MAESTQTLTATLPAAVWARRLALAGLLLCVVVVTLGAYVRLTAAGLGCPDWPGCYGHFSPIGAQQNAELAANFPHAPLDVGKAWREMIHRYAASTLGLIIVFIAALSIAGRARRVIDVRYALSLLGLVVFQGILGMLTVTWRLKPLIVTMHLVFGLATLGLLFWLWLSVRQTANGRLAPAPSMVPADDESQTVRRTRRIVLIALIALAVQIALGGWTSSNYAAVACPDFPTCQNAWWPQMDYEDAFVLWRGLGINYEGGILDHPARVAIHFTHRLGAIVATVLLVFAALTTLRSHVSSHARLASIAVLSALGIQLAIGISMVVRAFPLSLATAHNFGAALLLLATLALYHAVRVPRRAAVSGT